MWIVLPDSKKNVDSLFEEILLSFHTEWPISIDMLETLSYLKYFYPEDFKAYESRIISSMWLFYKTISPTSMFELVYSWFSDLIRKSHWGSYTPVQSNILHNISKNKYFSFSAPTSSWKSYVFRELIDSTKGDIIVVLPSRALISEYISTILELDSIKNNKSVLVLPFIENINIKNTSRRIFVITPERWDELFSKINDFNIELFLFDEAQISEEPIRWMKFDSFVRRVDKMLPDVKKVFAHPFVDNPEAQIIKHNFSIKLSNSKNYQQLTVGKIFISHNWDGDTFKYFSPFEDSKLKNLDIRNDIVWEIIEDWGTVLIFTSKKSIYSWKYIKDFQKYINLSNEVKDKEALAIIDELKDFIWANDDKKDKFSDMISMLSRWVAIHHGSMPLKARLLIEKFINGNFAKICFSTSTLSQGINMPFNIVWLDNFTFRWSENNKVLSLKNMIWRAWRTTSNNSFEYWYVIVNKKNKRTFCKRLWMKTEIDTISRLDKAIEDITEDERDIAEAIKNDSFDDDLKLTKTQIERIKQSDIDKDISFILDKLISWDQLINASKYYKIKKSVREKVKKSLRKVYIVHLKNQKLERSEKTILSTSLSILLWVIQWRSFSQIISLRYNYLSQKSERAKINREVSNGILSKEEWEKMKNNLEVKFSIAWSPIPNKSLPFVSIFDRGMSVYDVTYDEVIYDTYDYIDKVIWQSLSIPLVATLNLYYNRTSDERAIIFANYIQYWTNDNVEIWLVRYWLTFEEIDIVYDHIDRIDENGIIIKKWIKDIANIEKILDRYMS